MTNFDGGEPLSPFTQEPAADLRGKGLPWPVYLAGGLAVVAVVGFFAFRGWQTREKRKVHVHFMEQFAEFEKKDANDFWRCLFGKEGDARQFNQPEQVTQRLESALMTDPTKEFPKKVMDECAPKAIAASKKVKNFDPVPPTEYDPAMDKYSKMLAGLANAANSWAEGAPKRFEMYQTLTKLRNAGDSWSTVGDPRKPPPEALQFDRFLRCAVPDFDKLKEAQPIYVHLAGKCVGKNTDPEYLKKLRDECIPEALKEAPAKPPAAFKSTNEKLAGDYRGEAWDSCFKAMTKLSKKDDLAAFGKAWSETINASTEVRKVGKEQLSD